MVKPLLEPVSQLLPVSYVAGVHLEADLRQVGLLLSAREYYARGLILAVYSVPLCLIAATAGFHPVLAMAFVFLPIVLYRHFTTEHVEKLKDKRRRISYLLPTFIRSILYSLSEREGGGGVVGQVNLIAIFSNYLQVAPEIIRYDISLLITEMQSISVETGLRRFAERLRMPMVSHLCDILIGLARGQPQANALTVLARDIDTQYLASRKEELLHRPGEMYRALIPVGVVFMAMLLYAVVSDMIASVGYIG